MAELPPVSSTILLLVLSFAAAAAAAVITLEAAEDSGHFLQSQKSLKKPLREKLSHLRFYWHDIPSGPNSTAVRVAAAATSNASATAFGVVAMFDDPMTVGPALSSRLVGRAQGLYAFASKEEFALLVAMNLAFVEGKYNGSGLTVLARNAVVSASGVRELPVVGGSGLFRFARGYALAKTYSFDKKTGDTVVEYNVFVIHY